MDFPGGSVIKNPPAMQEMQVWALGPEDSLEKEMATHFSILASKIPWTEELGRLQSMGLQRAKHDLATEHACNFDIINIVISLGVVNCIPA